MPCLVVITRLHEFTNNKQSKITDFATYPIFMYQGIIIFIFIIIVINIIISNCTEQNNGTTNTKELIWHNGLQCFIHALII
jgi:hypothetical protein